MKTQPKQMIRKSDGVVVDIVEISGKNATILSQDGIGTEIVHIKELSKIPAEKAPKAEKAPRVKKEKPVREPREPKLGADGLPLPRLVPADLSRYQTHEEKSASGRKKIDVGDAASEILRPMDLNEAIAYVANEVGLSPDALAERYAGRNPGMQRMNIGNILRGELRRRAKAPELEAAKAEKAAKAAEAKEAAAAVKAAKEAEKAEAKAAKDAEKAAAKAAKEAAAEAEKQAA